MFNLGGLAMTDAATEFIAGVRVDLGRAMKARDGNLTRALRMLVAAVDNAQAIPVETCTTMAEPEPSGEPQRLALTPDALDAILQREVEGRIEEARILQDAGEAAAALAALDEAAVFARYRLPRPAVRLQSGPTARAAGSGPAHARTRLAPDEGRRS